MLNMWSAQLLIHKCIFKNLSGLRLWCCDLALLRLDLCLRVGRIAILKGDWTSFSAICKLQSPWFNCLFFIIPKWCHRKFSRSKSAFLSYLYKGVKNEEYKYKLYYQSCSLGVYSFGGLLMPTEVSWYFVIEFSNVWSCSFGLAVPSSVCPGSPSRERQLLSHPLADGMESSLLDLLLVLLVVALK